MTALSTNTDYLMILFLMGAFAATSIHHLFSYLSRREQTLSLIFSLWIALGFISMSIRFQSFYLQAEMPFQLTLIRIVETGGSYLGCLVLAHLAYGDSARFNRYLVPILLLTIIIYLVFQGQQNLTFGIVKISSYIFRAYLLYKVYAIKIPYRNVIVAASVIHGLAVAFFGIGPLSIAQQIPMTSKVLLIISYLVSINLYSVYLTKIAALTSKKLEENEFITNNLRELDHLKTKFFSNITHEFRTPLTLIQGPANELLEKTKDPESRQLLSMIGSNARRLLRLIIQLLDLAKLDASHMKLTNASLDLTPFFNITVSQFSSLAASKQIHLTWDLPKQLPHALIDMEKLEAILSNLISNAIKFTSIDGQVGVKVEYAKEKLKIEVKDTGRGIPPEKLNHVFDRFYQVEPTDSSHAEGTGIGLALVKEYTTLMQGVVEVESKVGTGTSFTITLPITIDAQPAVSAQAEQSAEPNSYRSANDERIDEEIRESEPLLLLVEDNDEIRWFIKSCLGPHYRFLEARNGKEGLDLARKEIPDVIISDLMMPEMDGMEFCALVKKDKRTDHIPFIMLTAKASYESKIEGLQTGADDYLIKPFNKPELVLKVQNLVGLREKLQASIKNRLLANATLVHPISAEEQFIVRAKAFIETHMADENLRVEMLADEMALSREQCYRKIIALTGLSTSAFIRKLRLQKAAQLLAVKWGPVSQIAYEVGFGNLSYFSKAFKEEFGKLPSEFDNTIA